MKKGVRQRDDLSNVIHCLLRNIQANRVGRFRCEGQQRIAIYSLQMTLSCSHTCKLGDFRHSGDSTSGRMTTTTRGKKKEAFRSIFPGPQQRQKQLWITASTVISLSARNVTGDYACARLGNMYYVQWWCPLSIQYASQHNMAVLPRSWLNLTPAIVQCTLDLCLTCTHQRMSRSEPNVLRPTLPPADLFSENDLGITITPSLWAVVIARAPPHKSIAEAAARAFVLPCNNTERRFSLFPMIRAIVN